MRATSRRSARIRAVFRVCETLMRSEKSSRSVSSSRFCNSAEVISRSALAFIYATTRDTNFVLIGSLWDARTMAARA
jgi:hypothetical protein